MALLAASGALILDDEGAVLLVEPVYKPSWEIPGGRMEDGETPRQACRRELREELGFDVELGRLLVVDWAPAGPEDRVLFVFDGGVFGPEHQEAIELPADELSSFALVEASDVHVWTDPRLGRRVAAALDALATGQTRYLEHGLPTPG